MPPHPILSPTLQWQVLPKCTRCNYPLDTPHLWCPRCQGMVTIPAISGPPRSTINLHSLWDLSPFLPSFIEPISLHEGATPLVHLKNMETLRDLRVKLEFRNPTGSFRDRASTLILSDAIRQNVHKIIEASTGSYGISLAAYAASAGISCINVIPHKIELSKVEQMKMYGAEIVQSGKTLEDATKTVQTLLKSQQAYVPTPNDNILTIEGQKTIALELALQSSLIDSVIIPRGTGSLLLSVLRGFEDALASGWIDNLPRLFAVSVKKSAGSHLAESLQLDDRLLLQDRGNVLTKTGGKELVIDGQEMVTDALRVAKTEGIFIEPASASVLVAAKQLVAEKEINLDSSVAILTGSGLNTMNLFATQLRTIKKVVWGLSETTTQRFEILNLIAEQKATHGIAIWETLGKKHSYQSIYQHLKSLKVQGLIHETQHGKKKEFTVTSHGKELWEKMRDMLDLMDTESE